MSQSAANILSVLFHPLLLATYLFSLFIAIDPMVAVPPGYNRLAQWLIVLVVAISTFIIPSLSIIMLKYTGTIKSIKLEERKERLVPFVYITLFYGFTAYYFNKQMMVTNLAETIFILTTVSIFLGAVITFFWKISVHALGMGGIVGILLVIAIIIPDSPVKYSVIFAILIAGLVLSARLRLDAHTPSQVYGGFILGLFVSFMLIFWI